MATASNIDCLRQKRNQHLDNIKFMTEDVDCYEQSDKNDVSVLKGYQGQLEDEWQQFRLVQDKLYGLEEEENTQEREALAHYISLAARLRNLIEGRRSSTPPTPTDNGFSAKCSSDNTFSSTTDNNDHVINANNTDDTAPHSKRFECPRNIALGHGHAIVNLPKINKKSPTALRHLINTVEQNLHSLNNLGESTTLNSIIISLVGSKLPTNIMEQWQLTLPNNEVPHYTHLLHFLSSLNLIKTGSTVRLTKHSPCPTCGGPHKIWRCDSFKAKSVSERLKDVEAASLCTNCLREGHSMADCYGRSCLRCGQLHNTMLHKDKSKSKSRSVIFSRVFYSSSRRSSKPSSTCSSSSTDHQKSTAKHKSETSRRDSSSRRSSKPSSTCSSSSTDHQKSTAKHKSETSRRDSSSRRSSKPSSTCSSSSTDHQKSTVKHKSETSRRDSSRGSSSSHRRTRKQ